MKPKSNNQIVATLSCPFEGTKKIINYDAQKSIERLLNYNVLEEKSHATQLVSTSLDYFCCCYPEVKTDYLLAEFIDLASWICILDDYIEINSNFSSVHEKINYINILRQIIKNFNFKHVFTKSLSTKNNSLILLLSNILHRISEKLPRRYIKILIESLDNFFSALCWEITYLKLDNKSINDLLQIKSVSSGVFIANTMLVCFSELIVEDKYFFKSHIISMINSILLVMSLDNDIYSYNKEIMESGNSSINVIKEFQTIFSIDERSSIQKTVSLRNHSLNVYMDLKSRLDNNESKIFGDYFNNLEKLIWGNLDFGQNSPRYNKKNIQNDDIIQVGKYAVEVKDDIYDLSEEANSILSLLWWY
ncbi:terpene synthase family, metal binding domain protein [Enterococcus sp. C1]|uniref:terpene synthase family protein n=1 Tax=Enterococcus sp. C1 TaxID=1182762 RepID=UPI000272192F|nr:terpene synthase family, metal-binding domain protein [Enterococcus sp. C1]EJF48110.1 terpene synthase family, metal binding domain protein [Enterococcus sp. C1]